MGVLRTLKIYDLVSSEKLNLTPIKTYGRLNGSYIGEGFNLLNFKILVRFFLVHIGEGRPPVTFKRREWWNDVIFAFTYGK